jgi:hypothetical protein
MLPGSVERVIQAIIEVARVPFRVQEVNRIHAVRLVVHVGAMPLGGGHVDEDAAAHPTFAEIVRVGVRRLETRIQPSIEIVDPVLLAG